MKLITKFLAVLLGPVAVAATFTLNDVEFIARSDNIVSYVGTVEAHELKLAGQPIELVRELEAFYAALDKASARPQQKKFLARRQAALQVVAASLAQPDALPALNRNLRELGQGKLIVLPERSAGQSIAWIIYLYAHQQIVAQKQLNKETSYLGGRAAYQSALLGAEYLQTFLDLSEARDPRRVEAIEMLKLMSAIKK